MINLHNTTATETHNIVDNSVYIHVGSFVTPQISGALVKEHSSRRAKEAAIVILNKQDHLASCPRPLLAKGGTTSCKTRDCRLCGCV
jgi:hypothetical protein